MKNISVILIACAAFLLSSCGDAEEKYRESVAADVPGCGEFEIRHKIL